MKVVEMRNSRIFLAGIIVEQHRLMQDIAGMMRDIIEIMEGNPCKLTLGQEKRLREMKKRLERTMEKNDLTLNEGLSSRGRTY